MDRQRLYLYLSKEEKMKLLQCVRCKKVYYTANNYWDYANKELLEQLCKEKVEIVECKCLNCQEQESNIFLVISHY